MPLFKADHLHLRFGSRVVLEDISLSFEEGTLSGIMGPNGAGKTTCFNVLTGHIKPDSGAVLFEDQDITRHSPQHIARLGVSRSFQMMNLFDEFTVFENIAVATPTMRRNRAQMFRGAYADGGFRDQVYGILEKVGLADMGGRMAKELSYGARRALEIAVALASEPKILFLDEPAAGLGADGRENLAKLIGQLRGSVSIVMIEHDMELLFGLADEISVIHWGQVIARGSPDELKRDPWVQNSNLGQFK